MREKKSDAQKSLKDRAKEFVRDVLESIEDLMAPPPKLIPIPVDRRRSRHR